MAVIYVFSGLGADARALQDIDLFGHEVHFINWEFHPVHNLSVYASRLLVQIKAPNPVLIGLSFGGMVAIEVARQIRTSQVILLASAKTASEIPFYYRWAGWLQLDRCVPAALLKWPNRLSNYFFGAHSPADQQLLAAILRDTDPAFLKWAIRAILTWRNKEVPPRVTHIHGTADHILPARFVKADIWIEGGGHFMTSNQANAISIILHSLL
jgi:pimeloyl-ACP methyl ester carboxylesterase